MGIDAHVTGCSAEALSLPIRDVLLGLGIAILFGHSKVDDMNHSSSLRPRTSYQEVIGLDITVD